MSDMRCLFLDIDGVLAIGSPMGEMDADRIAILERIVHECRPLYVVLSSSWRKYPDLREEVCRRIVIYSVTPTLPNEASRGDEIAEWLSKHDKFTAHAILDDDGDFHHGQPLFRTNPAVGLTNELADRIIGHFLEGNTA